MQTERGRECQLSLQCQRVPRAHHEPVVASALRQESVPGGWRHGGSDMGKRARLPGFRFFAGPICELGSPRRPARGFIAISPLTVAKAMDTFDLDPARWPELAADRGAWRTMLRSGEAPLGFRQAPPPPVPMPMSHFLVRPRRAAAPRTNAAIDASRRGANVNF